MILVTGGTGFIGQALIRQLVALGKPVRTLLRPSAVSPNLPRGLPVEVAVSSLRDPRGLRAAMKGVDIIYHLAGNERAGSKADLTGVDVEGTQTLVQMAMDAGVEKIVYLSHLGADRASAFAVLKAKALAEGFIVNSGLGYTIFRTAAVFGPGDQFTTSLAKLLRLSPGLFLMPGDGTAMLQPIWIEDLVACLILSLEDPAAYKQVYSIGGGEYLRFHEILSTLMAVMEIQRKVINVSPPYLRILSLLAEQVIPHFPISIYWLDYLAVDRTTAVDALPRIFGILPARFHQQLDYLKPRQRLVLRSRIE